jgi:hypothetical protein
MVELYVHSSTCLHGIVLNYLRAGTKKYSGLLKRDFEAYVKHFVHISFHLEQRWQPVGRIRSARFPRCWPRVNSAKH